MIHIRGLREASRILLCLVIGSARVGLLAQELEVRFHPRDFIYAYEIEPDRSLYSLVIQHVAFVNRASREIRLEEVRIDALVQGKTIESLRVPESKLEQSGRRMSAMEKQGILKLYDFHFQTSRYLDPDMHFSPTATLTERGALVLTGQAMLLHGLPDRISVTVRGKYGDGEEVTGQGSLRVATPESENDYLFPVSGTWYVGAAPSLHSHHRWAVNQEFAFDLLIVDQHGRRHRGAGTRPSDFYAYGRDVMAIADGTVVEAVSDFEDSGIMSQREGESAEAFEQRSLARQQELLSKGYKAPLGNYVTIRHGERAYSHYAHLQKGSLRVKVGDTVSVGQSIARVGQSGNSDEPHLHIHVTDGPDPMYTRGIPVKFKNVVVEIHGYRDRYLQTGWFVSSAK